MIIINEDKLKEFSKVDKSKIHFVLDFDRTVTSYLSESSWSILKNIKGISSNYIEEDKSIK